MEADLILRSDLSRFIKMKTIIKKYAFVFTALFLCVLAVSIKPTLIKAATTCYDVNDQVVDCYSADAVSADNGQGGGRAGWYCSRWRHGEW